MTIVLMPYKSMMRALYGMGPLAYERCRITVPHPPPSLDALHGTTGARGRPRQTQADPGSG